MDLSISPPPLKRRRTQGQETAASSTNATDGPRVLPSPFHLNKPNLPAENNHETLSLHDLIGDPLISEAWIFDFLFDIPWMMEHFDLDIRHLVRVKVVHGSWREEDANGIGIREDAAKFPNVEAKTAYMGEGAFGCHHSKMMVLFRRDDTAQVVVHTANMVRPDWEEMCQGVWRSPLLPLHREPSRDQLDQKEVAPLGSGRRFRSDLLKYLSHYGARRTGALIDQLKLYDFFAVRAAFVSSVPTRIPAMSTSSKPQSETSFGWLGLREILSEIPSSSPTSQDRAIIVAQVSSIATLGEKWISSFLSTLDHISRLEQREPQHYVMFPTADEIRRSIGGYGSGSSIHMKLQYPSTQNQMPTLRPILVKWAGDKSSDSGGTRQEAGRRRAAPHIKTFIRYSSDRMDRIDWAMLTSANLSKQAWGELPNKNKEIRICSYEVGVVVWPGLFGDAVGRGDRTGSPVMVPAFKHDTPGTQELGGMELGEGTIVGIRMPYDLPLVPYENEEDPWCAKQDHLEPDWRGAVWKVN